MTLPFSSIIDAAGIIAAFLPFSAIIQLALESRPGAGGQIEIFVAFYIMAFSLTALVFLFSAIIAAIFSETVSIILLILGFGTIVAMFLFILSYLRWYVYVSGLPPTVSSSTPASPSPPAA